MLCFKRGKTSKWDVHYGLKMEKQCKNNNVCEYTPKAKSTFFFEIFFLHSLGCLFWYFFKNFDILVYEPNSMIFLNGTSFLILEHCEVASTFATVLANQDDLQDDLDSGKYNRHVWLFQH